MCDVFPAAASSSLITDRSLKESGVRMEMMFISALICCEAP